MAEVFVSESTIHGLGVFAARAFSEGETVLIMDDSRVVDDERPLRPDLGEYEYHCDYLEGGKVILQGYPERHINSSCDPNTYVRRSEGVSRVIARRHIESGEEITYDYIIDCDGGELWQCACGSGRCRGRIVSSFFDLPVELQKEYLPLLNEWFVREHRQKVESLRRATDT